MLHNCKYHRHQRHHISADVVCPLNQYFTIETVAICQRLPFVNCLSLTDCYVHLILTVFCFRWLTS